MLIRTQDKKSILNLDNIMGIYTNIENPTRAIKEEYETNIEYYFKGAGILGTYSSEKKALKVLDMIQDTYTEGNEWLRAAGKVFVMPADEEVNV
jgi:hypothetical protein